jgi:hypothetical protein
VDASNLVVICENCNIQMPNFRPGERDLALSWVKGEYMTLDQRRKPISMREVMETEYLKGSLDLLDVDGVDKEAVFGDSLKMLISIADSLSDHSRMTIRVAPLELARLGQHAP